MRQSLVLFDETARHPFRATLRPQVSGVSTPMPERPKFRITGDDMRGFFMAYIGCFLAVTLFIA